MPLRRKEYCRCGRIRLACEERLVAPAPVGGVEILAEHDGGPCGSVGLCADLCAREICDNHLGLGRVALAPRRGRSGQGDSGDDNRRESRKKHFFSHTILSSRVGQPCYINQLEPAYHNSPDSASPYGQ